MTTVKVRFDPLSQAIEDVLSCHKALGAEKEGLDSFLNNLRGTWQGSANLSWDRMQKDWNIACEDVNRVLHNLFVALEVAHGNYTGTEKALAQMWGA